TTVLDRPASRPVGSLAIGGVGGSQAILVCLGGASGSRRATSYADTGRAGPPTRVDGLTAGARRLGPARDQRSTTSPLVKVPAPAARPSNHGRCCSRKSIKSPTILVPSKSRTAA